MVLISKAGLLALVVGSLGGAASAEQQEQRVLALDQDTHVDRNPDVPPQLDITGGTNGTDEIKIEFLRADLENMYNDTDGGEARIVVRFFPVNGTDNSCLKDGGAVYSWVSGDEGFVGLSTPEQSYFFDVDGGISNYWWMTGSIEDKTDINGTATSAINVAGKSRTQMLVLIDILKSKITDPEGDNPNPLWHPEAADPTSVTVGDFKVCVNIQVERDLVVDGANKWVPLLWRDFLVFMGVNLKDNVFSIGDDEGGIEVQIDAVENATSTYEKPNLAFYQCIGNDNYDDDTPIGDDVAQNGLIQMCLMPESDDVYICELEMDVDVDGTEEAMQKVNKIALADDDETPAGTPAQSSIVDVYDRKYVDCDFGPGQCNVQKWDTQTLADQAGKFLNITGTVTYCFRAETSRRLENVPFNLNDNQLRSLQQADEGAGAEPFSVSLKIDKIQFDGDKVSDEYVEGDVTKENTANGGGNFDSYSAAAVTSFGGLLKMFGAVAGVMAVLF